MESITDLHQHNSAALKAAAVFVFVSAFLLALKLTCLHALTETAYKKNRHRFVRSARRDVIQLAGNRVSRAGVSAVGGRGILGVARAINDHR
jgi:hypothetical protein